MEKKIGEWLVGYGDIDEEKNRATETVMSVAGKAEHQWTNVGCCSV